MKKGIAVSILVFLVSSANVTTRIDAFVVPSFLASGSSRSQTTAILKCRTGTSYPHNSRYYFSIDNANGLKNINNKATTPQVIFSKQTQLYAKQDDKDPIEKDNRTDEKISSLSIAQKVVMIWKVLSTRLMNFLPTLRVAIASFTVGAVFALTVVFVPVYNSVDKMSEPVTLFETILTVSKFYFGVFCY
jgi:hypothetical protein